MNSNYDSEPPIVDLTEDLANETITIDDTHIEDEDNYDVISKPDEKPACQSNNVMLNETITPCLDSDTDDEINEFLTYKDSSFEIDDGEDDDSNIMDKLIGKPQSQPVCGSDNNADGIDLDPCDTSMSEPRPKKQAREETRQLKQLQREQKKRELEMDKLHKQAKKANAANKALQNCISEIHKGILDIIKDHDARTINADFDLSSLPYIITENPKMDNCISWRWKKTKVVDDECVITYEAAHWMIVVMEGKNYLHKLKRYKQDPDHADSIKTFLKDTRTLSKCDISLMVYGLEKQMKIVRAEYDKNYRKAFKQRHEGVATEASNNILNNNEAAIGVTDLQEWRLDLLLEFSHQHTEWKINIEFYEKLEDIVRAFVRHTIAIARYPMKQTERANFDWSIDMDKERATDPTKSEEDAKLLWQRQLQQFDQVTLPVAKAISLEYPNPASLIDQYESNLTRIEAENLLAELNVQNNRSRQIGLKISKMIHCFLTDQDPDVHVGLI